MIDPLLNNGFKRTASGYETEVIHPYVRFYIAAQPNDEGTYYVQIANKWVHPTNIHKSASVQWIINFKNALENTEL